MKHVFFVYIATSLLLALSSCKEKEQPKPPEVPVTLVMAEVNPPDTIVGRMDTAFKQKAEELSNGSVTIDLYCSGILGDEAQVMSLIVKPESSIQLARVSASLASYGGQKSRLLSIPYTFSSDEHFWRFAASPLAQEILDEPYENKLGVKGLFYGEEGFRHFFSTQKITTLADIKGKKVRVSGAQVLQDLVEAFEAEPVTVAFTDLYATMQTGLLDVADQPITNYLSNAFNEIAPYMILDGHMLGAVQVLINAAAWDALSDNQRAILTESAQYASQYCRQIVDEANEEALTALKNEGATITELADKRPWQAACRAMITESSKDFPELYQRILELDN